MTGILAKLKDKLVTGNDLHAFWRLINTFFVRREGNKVLSDNNYTDADRDKVQASFTEMDFATDAEVQEMLDEIYGQPESA